ncbi:saccharopine dehydrogenase family protein [Pseudopelagicola sp. nBUS_19]|uniref:saccharopine dehydrogenase family protein n=1 Tax=Pseudopelagicola sp. nBUS_19 TaxID=3395316 RepID=UPI003EBE6DD3
MTIHWCGTGLSAIPGLRRLIKTGQNVTVWNRTVATAKNAIGDLTQDIQAFDMKALKQTLTTGDIIVSMLPANWHVPLAELCISKGANFVSSSYISPEMKALDTAARGAGVICCNEVGLDPGIDHLMAHALVHDYRSSDAFNPANAISFTSYCGGIPKHPNPFRYKFSWSPLGVLQALRSPSRSIRDHTPLDVGRPWDAISNYEAPLPNKETFEVYPNRDSIPFMKEYNFDPEWSVKEFVRGTLRLNGWADAWADVFTEIEKLSGLDGDVRLAEMSKQFWSDNTYDDGEPDRVVLCVELKAEHKGAVVWNKTYVMDAWGDADGSAMARLVSIPVSLAIEAVLNGEMTPGVHAAPGDPKLFTAWLDHIKGLAQHLKIVNHLDA